MAQGFLEFHRHEAEKKAQAKLKSKSKTKAQAKAKAKARTKAKPKTKAKAKARTQKPKHWFTLKPHGCSKCKNIPGCTPLVGGFVVTQANESLRILDFTVLLEPRKMLEACSLLIDLDTSYLGA